MTTASIAVKSSSEFIAKQPLLLLLFVTRTPIRRMCMMYVSTYKEAPACCFASRILHHHGILRITSCDVWFASYLTRVPAQRAAVLSSVFA